MAIVKFFKLDAIPDTWEADAIYFIANGAYAETYITTSGGVEKFGGNSQMINELIAAAAQEGIDFSDYYTKTEVDNLIPDITVKVDKVTNKGLSTEDYTTAEKTKLSGIEAGAQANAANTVIDSNYVHTDNNYTSTEKTKLSGIAESATANSSDAVLLARANHTGAQAASTITEDSTHRFATDTEKAVWNAKQAALGFTAVPDTRTVNGHGLSGNVTVSKADVGLTNADDTSDANKPVSTAQLTALNLKQNAILSASVTGSDVTTTNATATDITGLTLAVAANKRYKLTAVLYTGCSSTGGVRFTWAGPSGSAILVGVVAGSTGSVFASSQARIPAASGTLTASGNAFNAYNGATGMVIVTAYFTTSVTTGNLKLQFASGTVSQTSTIFIGSTMDLTEIT